MRTPLIAGNWKMHKTLAEARELIRALRERLDTVQEVDILVCPPFQHLFPMAKALADSVIGFGAQNAHYEPEGAFTGEVSVPMIRETGATHVIIGHSERRQYFHEDGEVLAKKVRAVTGGGLTVIYCVGERLEQRDAGETESVVARQVREVLDRDVPADRLVVAYEPVWAIGTGRTATPEQAQPVHALIRSELASIYGKETAEGVRILYGGSVKPGNAADLLAQTDIDGALVGGASLVAEDFAAIVEAARAVVARS
ncbi:MAG: triose-phosphate isomerase [Planctomycetota bacterium]|nr:MAG: triose-phosphate isomerase [Planctomycetota bacterium]